MKQFFRSRAWWVILLVMILGVTMQRMGYAANDYRDPNADSFYEMQRGWHFNLISQPTAALRIPYLLPYFDSYSYGAGDLIPIGSHEIFDFEPLSLTAPVSFEGIIEEGNSTRKVSILNWIFVVIDLSYLFGVSAFLAYWWLHGARLAKILVCILVTLVFTPVWPILIVIFLNPFR